MLNIEEIINKMTVEEKAALVSGTDFMYTNSIPRLNVPTLSMADGPHGLRKQTGKQDNGISQSESATAFPTAVATASSWNPDNLFKMGKAIAKECKHYDVHMLLGPGTNIKRNPLCGRNFEYFSEDPFLSGEMGMAEVKGIQSEAVGVSVKHFALNNSENYRFLGNSIADERAMREIYLKPFEKIVKSAKPSSIMCAYNRVNGIYCSENKWLLTNVLRDEWGYDGAVITDWGAIRDRVDAIKAGLDLEMPGDTAICRRKIIDAVKDGTLSMKELDKAVFNLLKLVKDYVVNHEKEQLDFSAHHRLAAEIAEDCAVLMKNDGILPLKKSERYLFVGELFEKMRYQGAGSSMISPAMLTSPIQAAKNMGIDFVYEKGYLENKIEPQDELIKKAVLSSDTFDSVVVFAGLTDYVESEGCDRENLKLPQNQVKLIDALAKTGKKIVVVLYGGGVVELPFAKNVNAILNMFLPGQNGGTATMKLLFGDICPSGKLAETWVEKYEDVPFYNEFSKTPQEVYKESIFVGYRYYSTIGKRVSYPFGYGLSYTKFNYGDFNIQATDVKISISCKIKNTGRYRGGEVVQVYVKAPDSKIFKPIKELKAFKKVHINPDESCDVNLSIPIEDLRYFNIKEKRWVLESGEYDIQICSDCDTIIFSQKVKLDGEDAENPYSDEVSKVYKKADISKMNNQLFEKMSSIKIPNLPDSYPINIESRFTDLKQSFMGRILFNSVLGVAHKQMKDAQKLPESIERDNKIKGALFLQRILESNSIRSMSMSAGKSFPYNFALGFVELANGHLIKGAKHFLKPVKAPKLPKENMEE